MPRAGLLVRVWVSELSGMEKYKGKLSLTLGVAVQRANVVPSGRDHGEQSVTFPLEPKEFTVNAGVELDRVLFMASVSKPSTLGRTVIGTFRGSVADFPEGAPREHELPICSGKREVASLRVRVQVCSPDTPMPDPFDSAVVSTPSAAAPGAGSAMVSAAGAGMVVVSSAAPAPVPAPAPAPAPAPSGLYPSVPHGAYPGAAAPGFPPAPAAAPGYGGAHGYPPAPAPAPGFPGSGYGAAAPGYPGAAPGYGGAHGYPPAPAPAPGYPGAAPGYGYPPASAPYPGGSAPPPYPGGH